MKCRTLNRRGHTTRIWHRLWCRTCRESQDVDSMIGFGLAQMQDTPSASLGLTRTLAALDLAAGGKSVRRAARRVGLRQLANTARVGLFGLGGLGAWMAYMDYTPPLNIPPKIAPARNAMDYFKAACAQMKYEQEVGDAGAEPTKDQKPNPRVHRWERVNDLDHPGKFTMVERVYEHDHLYTPADRQFLLDENRAALATLREGLKYPYVDTYVRSFNTMFPYYAQYRALARLLHFETKVKSEQGDWNGAMQSCLDSVEMGVKMPNGGPLIGRLVGIACEDIGRKQAWKIVEHLDRTAAQAALARITAIRAQHVPFTDTLQEEGWEMQSSLREIMKSPNWRMGSFNLFMGEGDKMDWRGLLLYGWSNRTLINDVETLNRENLRRGSLPYQAARAQPPIPQPFDPLCQILFPMFDGARFKDVCESETQDDLLRVTLALRLYALDNGGAAPDTLARLTPKYLADIPADLFASGNAPLRYRRTGTRSVPSTTAAEPAPPRGSSHKPQPAVKSKPPYDPDYPGRGAYVLYSVGPDGRDDGGQAIDNALHPATDTGRSTPDSPSRYIPNPGSRGDIVAGLNWP